MMIGFRGFPGVQGGVENHAQHLCPLLVELGCEVVAVVRTPYIKAADCAPWNGVEFVRVWTLRVKGVETVLHTLLGVLVAAVRRPDILHIHAIGPAIFAPLARLLGLRVVVTHHGADYMRQKWGGLAKAVLRAGERLGVRGADGVIAISEGIRTDVEGRYGRSCALIPNGVVVAPPEPGTGALDVLGVVRERYFLSVGRLVKEKRHLDLIDAFERATIPGWGLVIVGSADHPDAYFRQLEKRAREVPGVVLAGFRSGIELRQLYSHAGAFVLPSTHEGLPIALLEALGYGIPVIASDIPANLEVGLESEAYFPVGDVDALAERLADSSNQSAAKLIARRKWISVVEEKYSWRIIASATNALYKRVASNHN